MLDLRCLTHIVLQLVEHYTACLQHQVSHLSCPLNVQHDGGKITSVATSYRNGECRSLKVTVFGPYQVLPDVIVSITPHAVVVKHYYNGWLRDYTGVQMQGVSTKKEIAWSATGG